jgi:cytochrome c
MRRITYWLLAKPCRYPNRVKPALGRCLCSALLLLTLTAPAQAAQARHPEPATSCSQPARAVPLTDAGCSPLAPPQISCHQPADVEGELSQPNFNSRQRAADLYAWQQFIALHWPAAATHPGQPDPAKRLDASGPRVWETWRDVGTLFLPGGVDPGPWEQAPALPPVCATAGATKVLHRIAKVDDLLDAMVQPTGADATRPPILTDQAGRTVYFDIRVNRVAYEYVRAQGLFNGDVQQQTDAVSFPAGAQLVKGAWRVLDDGQGDRFVTSHACICRQGPDGQPLDCAPRRVGLVGLHLMAKTPSAPQWIWSTYEQVDNVPPTSGGPASFNDPHCGPADCPPNQVQPLGVATQVTRIIPIPDQKPDCARPDQARDDLKTLNDDLARALRKAGSVLANYQLVGVQWPVNPAASDEGPATVFQVQPALLGNTTLETFIQGTSSCMGCHAMAGSNRQDRFVSADFSFTLNGAQPAVPATTATPAAPPPDAASLSGLDLAAQALVQRGYQLTTQTHELRPDLAPARLHCSSCHLDAGRNPAASWWVGMETHYPVDPAGPALGTGPAVTTLQERINGCFSRSMNGRPVCVAGSGDGSCATDPDMGALIAYMRWVDRRYRPSGRPARGFPALAPGQGDPTRGQAIFTQKCAFCHGEEGQGRDANGVYFRPPLWGPASFHNMAGLATTTTLAEFIHANMPLGSAGVLTIQEAWDLAAFIAGQCRPGKTCAEE